MSKSIWSVFLDICSINGLPFSHCGNYGKKQYPLTRDPIDVIIPCIEKDKDTLDACIRGIRKNGTNINRIFVISPYPITTEAEWFDEKHYPFNKMDIARIIYGSDEEALRHQNEWDRIGWILQQLLKLYAPLVIPGISPNVLALDADTIFLNPVTFLNASNGALFCTAGEWHSPYFIHGAKLLPGFTRIQPSHSGITHHMLFQKSILEDFWNTIESIHHLPGWEAYCRCIERETLYYAPCSEYELYFNYALAHTDQVEIRPLKWDNISYLSQIKNYQNLGCHDIAFMLSKVCVYSLRSQL